MRRRGRVGSPDAQADLLAGLPKNRHAWRAVENPSTPVYGVALLREFEPVSTAPRSFVLRAIPNGV